MSRLNPKESGMIELNLIQLLRVDLEDYESANKITKAYNEKYNKSYNSRTIKKRLDNLWSLSMIEKKKISYMELYRDIKFRTN